MKKPTLSALLAASALCAVPIVLGAQDPVPGPSPTTQIADLRDDVSALTAQVSEQARQIAQLEGALTKLSRSAQAMAQVLDEAEAQGFAAGINYHSRETLLAGWRQQLATFQELGPKQPEPEEPSARHLR